MMDMTDLSREELICRVTELETKIIELKSEKTGCGSNNNKVTHDGQQLETFDWQLEVLKSQQINSDKIFKALLDGIEDVIYVSDPETYELIHVNETAQKIWGKNLVGKKCYKALQNRDEPCPFCTNNIIFNKQPGKTFFWEFQNEVNKQWFRCADRAIDWPDGRKVRFEIASDISKIKQTEEKLKAANQQLLASEQQLKASNQQLDASNQQLTAANEQLEANEKELKFTSSQLRERLKEMNCLYSVFDSISRNTDINYILNDTIEAIPAAWHYPEITVARITYDDKILVTENFEVTNWKLSANIHVGRRNIGCIEVYYTVEKPLLDEGPFLKEERKLLNTLVEILGRAIEKINAEKQLKASNQQLMASEQQLKASNQQLDASNQQLTATNQQLEASEKQVKMNLERFKALLDGIEDVIYVSDPESYELVHVNKTAQKYWGNNLVGKKCYKALQNRDEPCPFCTNKIIFGEQLGQTYIWDYQNELTKIWYRCADRAIDWPDGRKLRFEIASDITEMKQANENLRESEERIRLITDNASEMIYQMCLPDGNYEFVSSASKRIFGYLPEEFYKDPTLIQEIIHPDWKDYFALEWENLISGNMPPTYEYQIIDKDGKTKWLHQGNTLIKDKSGKVSKILGVVSDITKRKEDEFELEKINSELTVKTDELQQILYITSHDLRSPLVNVQGFSKEMETSAGELSRILNSDSIPNDIKDECKIILEEELPESIHYITTSIAKMDLLLKGLLQISRLGRQKTEFEPLAMNDLMLDVINSFKYEIDKNKVEIVIGELPRCLGDQMQINQLFSNLIGNAIKFMDPMRLPVIKVDGETFENYSHFTVTDNGIGIHPDHQKKVFELFHKLDPNKPGSGLGMNIVKQIVEKHNGKISLESESGKGTIIHVFLPGIKITKFNFKK